MGFFNERCPNCGKATSKQAAYCNGCGCPTASGWSACHRCNAAVGADSKHCWKCGAEQLEGHRRAIFEDRWMRSAEDFAVRVTISRPRETLRHGLQIDEGTLALVYQDGRFVGLLEAGYHTFDTFLQRLLKIDPGHQVEAVLLDATGAEVDFLLEDIRTRNEVPVDVRVRLLFRVTDARRFSEQLLQRAALFTTGDLTRQFQGDVRDRTQEVLATRTLEETVSQMATRELLERELVPKLAALMSTYGLEIVGVRLADFGGDAVELLRSKLGDLSRATQEYEVNRKLADAMRAEKISAYRDEEDLKAAIDRIHFESGRSEKEREHEAARLLKSWEDQRAMDALRGEYSQRREEILARIEEQRLKHQSDFEEVEAEIRRREVRFVQGLSEEDRAEAQKRRIEIAKAEADRKAAEEGVTALEAVNAAKLKRQREEAEIEVAVEKSRMEIRSGATREALVTMVSPEIADRLIRLAEIEAGRGLSVNEALALVAEKSPDVPRAVAELFRSRKSDTNA